jgi:hypothetical protein
VGTQPSPSFHSTSLRRGSRRLSKVAMNPNAKPFYPKSVDSSAHPRELQITTSPIDKIPDELVDYIFALSSEGPSDTSSYFGKKLRYSSPPGRKSLSPFRQVVSLVCRKWRCLAIAKSKEHLWHFGVDLDYHRDRNIDRSILFANFRHQLSLSEGCLLNVRVSMDPDDQTYQAQRFNILTLSSLRDYRSRLVSLELRYAGSHLYRFLQEFKFYPKLHTIALVGTPSATLTEPHDIESVATLHGPTITVGENDQTLGDALEWLQFKYGLFGQVARMLLTGTNIRFLHLDNWTSEEQPCDWDSFISLLQDHPQLSEFDADVSHISNLPGVLQVASAPWPMQWLQSLRIEGPIEVLFYLFRAFQLPRLARLHIRGASHSEMPKSYNSYEQFPVPSLRELWYYNESENGSKFLSSLIHYELDFLLLGTNPIRFVPTFSPRILSVWTRLSLSPGWIHQLVSNVNFNLTTNIRLSGRFTAYETKDPKSVLEDHVPQRSQIERNPSLSKLKVTNLTLPSLPLSVLVDVLHEVFVPSLEMATLHQNIVQSNNSKQYTKLKIRFRDGNTDQRGRSLLWAPLRSVQQSLHDLANFPRTCLEIHTPRETDVAIQWLRELLPVHNEESGWFVYFPCIKSIVIQFDEAIVHANPCIKGLESISKTLAHSRAKWNLEVEYIGIRDCNGTEFAIHSW